MPVVSATRETEAGVTSWAWEAEPVRRDRTTALQPELKWGDSTSKEEEKKKEEKEKKKKQRKENIWVELPVS